MKIRVFILLVLLLGVSVIIVHSLSSNRKFVDRAVRYTQWSKDSRYLFYSKSEKRLFRYDVKTGNRQTYLMPERLDGFDVSPDGRFVMFPMVRNKTYGVYIMDLDTQKIQRNFAMKNAVREFTTGVDMHGKRLTALESLKWITSICWLRQDAALLLVERPKDNSDIYLLDMKRNTFKELRMNIEDFSWTSDDSGFIYADELKNYHFYRLSDGTDKLLDFGKLDISEMGFLYITKHQIVFTYNNREHAARVMDLATMAIRPISLPEAENISDISNDMRWCLTGSSAHPSALQGGWVSNKVYVMGLPQKTVQQLRRLEQKP